jgi:hypothetical protein
MKQFLAKKDFFGKEFCQTPALRYYQNTVLDRINQAAQMSALNYSGQQTILADTDLFTNEEGGSE